MHCKAHALHRSTCTCTCPALFPSLSPHVMTRSLSSPGPPSYLLHNAADGRPLQRGRVYAVRGSFRDGEGCVHMTCTRTCPARLSVAACNLGPTAQHTLATPKRRLHAVCTGPLAIWGTCVCREPHHRAGGGVLTCHTQQTS